MRWSQDLLEFKCLETDQDQAVIGQFNCQSPALATPELVGGLIDRWGGIILIKTWMLKLWQPLQEKLIWYKSFCLERNVVKNLQSWLSPSYTLDINDWDNNQTTSLPSCSFRWYDHFYQYYCNIWHKAGMNWNPSIKKLAATKTQNSLCRIIKSQCFVKVTFTH